MSSFEFMECILAPENARPTKRQYISSSGEDLQSFGSKITLNGLSPLYIPGKKDGFIDVVIAYIETTENFFCQLQDQGDDIIKMSVDMGKFYSDNGPGSKPLVNPLPGTLCAAKYSADNCWYRGFVLNRPRPTVFEIYFIDYGNTEMVYLTDLRTLSSDFSKYPPRAFRCALKNVPNNQCTIRKFKEKTEGQKLVLKLESGESNVFAVTLFDFDPKTKLECNINDLLNAQIQKENDVGLTNGSTKNDEIDDLDSAKVAPEKAAPPIEIVANGQRSPMNIKPAQISPAICRLEIFPPFKIPTSKTVDVFLPHAVSFDEFYVHLTSRSDDLDIMTTKLQDHCQRNAKTLPADAVKLGAACATVFAEDGCFYRCVPIEIKHKLVKVHFVDYGNEQIVDIERLYELSDELIDQPCFTVKCRLDTLKLKDSGDLDDDIKNDFDSLAIDEKTNKPIVYECNFLSKEEPCLVSLQRNGKMFDDLLASMGHCEKIVAKKKCSPCSFAIAQNFARKFPRFKLEDKSDKIYISVAVTPYEFYIHLTSKATKLDSMTEGLQRFCRQEAVKLPKEKCRIGTACAAIYSVDGAFYRCTIKNVKNSSVDVYFVDYGNHENVPTENLYELCDYFIELPCFAARCFVNSVQPVIGSREFDPSIKDDMDALAVDSNGEVKKYYCEFLSNQEPYLVSLENSRKENFITPLVKMGRCRIVLERAMSEQIEISCSKLQSNFEFDKIPESFPHADWPAEMPICEVCIAYVYGPNELYLQKFDTIDESARFSERLQISFKNFSKIIVDSFKIGSPYAAIFADDEQSYRCVPLKYFYDGNAEVQFVDYGNREIMHIRKLHTFPLDDSGSEFLTTPRFVVKARLAGVRPARESATGYGKEAVDFLDDYAVTNDGNPKKFICKVVESSATKEGPLYHVELIYEGKSLADVLIENNICQKA